MPVKPMRKYAIWGIEVCTDICSRLIKHGTKSIHIYSLNRVPSSEQLVKNLGLI
ncbi:MAG: hypothetical protein EBQ87_09115 [Planctomycetes bacterium]|nr:hypothetical protein [Planctomycetota bacterium]